MGYPCIYQKFPIPWDDTSKFPRPSHKNQMIWSQYHTIPWDGIDPPYPRPSQTFPTRNLNLYIYKNDYYEINNKSAITIYILILSII